MEVDVKNATAREMLDLIDQFISTGGVEAGKLVDVMSALHGPDTRSDMVKRDITQVIRSVAFPLTAANYSNGASRWMMAYPQEGDDVSKIVVSNEDMQYHFRTHAEVAAAALGLTIKRR